MFFFNNEGCKRHSRLYRLWHLFVTSLICQRFLLPLHRFHSVFLTLRRADQKSIIILFELISGWRNFINVKLLSVDFKNKHKSLQVAILADALIRHSGLWTSWPSNAILESILIYVVMIIHSCARRFLFPQSISCLPTFFKILCSFPSRTRIQIL